MRTILLDTVGSTNDEAYQRANAGEAMPFALRALEQHAGRGRLKRAWASPRGGVWMTVADVWHGPVHACMALRIAMAVWESLVPELDDPADLRVKWPNDLLLDGRKLAGVLCETRHYEAGTRCLLVGVGVNADFDEAHLPDDTRLPATTLRSALGRPVDADALAHRLGEAIGRTLGSRDRELDEGELRTLLDRLAFLDEKVRLHRLDGTVAEGRLEGLSPDGRAVIRSPRGLEFVEAGEVDRASRPPESNG